MQQIIISQSKGMSRHNYNYNSKINSIFIQKFADDGWQFSFREALLSREDLTYSSNTDVPEYYWNGEKLISIETLLPNFNTRLEIDATRMFNNQSNLQLDFEFSGDLYHQSEPQGQEVRYGFISHVYMYIHVCICTSLIQPAAPTI